MARPRWLQCKGQSILEYLLVASVVIAMFVVVAGIIGHEDTGPMADMYRDSGVSIDKTGVFLGELGK